MIENCKAWSVLYIHQAFISEIWLAVPFKLSRSTLQMIVLMIGVQI
jgi:hypothetical protein